MKKNIILILSLFFLQSCNKNKREDSELTISVENMQRLNKHSLLVKLVMKNNSNVNYLLPISPKFYLTNKKLFPSIGSQVIASDSKTDLNENIQYVLQEFTEKKIYSGFSHEAYKLAVAKNFEEYLNSLFFISKNSKKEIYIVFNNYSSCGKIENCNQIFSDKLTKIRVDDYTKKDIETIDSLIMNNKLDYVIYNKKIDLIDSLYLTK